MISYIVRTTTATFNVKLGAINITYTILSLAAFNFIKKDQTKILKLRIIT